MDIKEINKKFEKILLDWWKSDPVMFNTYCLLDRIPDPNQDTIGLNIKGRNPTLNYNPNFVNTISAERLELIMVIEGYKILLRHCTTRLKDPRQLSSLASNLTINQLLNSSLQMLLEGIDEITPDPAKFGLPPQECFEVYFRGLFDNAKKANQMIEQIWGSMSKDQKKDAVDKAKSQMEKDIESDKNTPRDENGFKNYDNDNEAMKDYYDPRGTSNQGWESNNLFDSAISSLIEKNKSLSRQWGKHTGDIKDTILAANEVKISYKDIIRKFSESVKTLKTTSSRMKVNRRYDLERPGKRRSYKPKIIFAVDVSGSISDEDLSYGFAIINKLIFYAEIIYVQFDTEIKSIEKTVTKAKSSFKVHGRGGTDFNAICKLSDELKCDGLVIYTDGAASAPIKPKSRVLWLLHAKNATVPVTWGYRAYLDRFENNHLF